MVGVMVRMKLAMLRHGSGTRRTIGGLIGLALAVFTLLVASFAPLEAAPSLLAAIMCAWMLGWVIGPSGVSGGSQSLKPEYFALEPVPVRKITGGLLASSFVSVTVPVTALATLSLLLLAVRFGFLAAVVALIAVPLQVLFVVLLSRVVTELSGASLRMRVGVEITAIQHAAVLAACFSVYMLYQAVSQYTDVIALVWNAGIPAPFDTVLLALPSGWGIAALSAAGEGNALLSLGLLLALAVSCGLLLTAWTGLTRTRLNSPTTGSRGGGRKGLGIVRGLLPSGPLGAVIGRELRTWSQDPRRALELRVALWTGVLVCGLGLLVGLTFMIPLAGLITVALAALMSLNVYGLDGSALWQTLLTPAAERHDVRGRQIAWLVVFVPVAVVLSVGGILITGQDWAWPFVTALMPALVGAGAGLSVLFAVAWPAPGPDPNRHGGNPLESGDASGQFNVMFPILLFVCVPPTGVTAAGYFLENPALMWTGTAVGVVLGLALGWGLGRAAIRVLEKRGPELLGTLRWGTSPGSEEDAPTAADGAVDPAEGTVLTTERAEPEGEGALLTRVEGNLDRMSPGVGVAMTLLGLTFWLPIYQGVMSLVGIVMGVESRSWHLPLYLPEVWQLPVAVGMILLGLVMVGALARLLLGPGRGSTEDDGA